MAKHWLFALISVVGFVFALLSHSAGWMAIGLAVGFLFAVVTVFAFAASRIDDSSRQESLNEIELAALRASLPRPAEHADAPPK